MTDRPHHAVGVVCALVLLLGWTLPVTSQVFVKGRAESGEGIYGMLRRHLLPTNAQYIEKFRELNEGLLRGSGQLKAGVWYELPILVFEYDRVGVRTSLGIDDLQLAEKIERYNQALYEAGLRLLPFTDDGLLWAPFFDVNPPPAMTTKKPPSTQRQTSKKTSGTSYSPSDAKTPITDRVLAGHYFYLVSGHGGPDPGAIGHRDGLALHEDEYAYDITLRLARVLEGRGATVYMIVQDPNDDIRDQAILKGNQDEVHIGGTRIPRQTVARLQKRADIINELFKQNRSRAKSQHAVEIHVDSRSNSQRIDLFYYYQRNSEKSRRLALALHKRVKAKYDRHQPGRGYSGTVSARNLFMLKHVAAPMVYIEVANIRNRRDQDRLLIVNNRQAVANWLCEGIVDYIQQ